MDRDTIEDQAEKLRQSVKNSTEKLPPRREIHKDKKKKTKLKIKYPIIRLLALFFVLIPILILSYTFHFKDELKTIVPKVSTENYDTIDFAKPDEKEIVSKEEKSNEVVDGDTVNEEEESTENDQAEEQIISDKDGENAKPTTNEPTERSEKTETSSNKSKTQDYKVITHKVAAEETLFSISIKYYKSRSGEQIIREWNNLDETKIYEGQILEIPLKEDIK